MPAVIYSNQQAGAVLKLLINFLEFLEKLSDVLEDIFIIANAMVVLRRLVEWYIKKRKFSLIN